MKGRESKKKQLEALIFARVNKWGRDSNLLEFEDDPLWKVNPYGAINVYHHRLNSNFWKFKSEAFDVFGAVDGAIGVQHVWCSHRRNRGIYQK